ncbi:MAG: TonB-dependent receptor, partial [Acidobacteriota bacterium]|nr:TonB-dependent receptor [Acidobacteriota bacterium]
MTMVKTAETRARTLWRGGSLFLILTFLAAAAFAQSNSGSIVGTISDPAGAIVSGAKVTVTNNATKEPKEIVAGNGGDFTATNLEPGVYSVQIAAAGFKTLLFSTVTVVTNARVPLDATFTEVSGTGENVVTITNESAPLVESETSSRGDVITGKQVTDLPIGQRNFTVLASLSPGVNRPQAASFGLFGGGNEANSPNFPSAETARFRESGGSAISSNGARVTQNEFLLDGVDNNESQFRQIVIFPNPDAISEFKIETSVPRAELGRAGGAIISTTLKSGGNAFHGSAFEFYQGRFASAVAAQYDDNNNAPNAQGIRPRTVPNYVSHNYGGTIGGPIYFLNFNEGGRKLYDGRNRTFFFVDYAAQRGFIPATETDGNFTNRIPVPTARERVGDFSQLLRPGTSQTYTLAGGGTVIAPVGTIFTPNGVPIPGNDLRNCPSCGAFSAFARNYLNAFPLPTFDTAGENYNVGRVVRPKQDVYSIRIDHKLFAGNNLFGRYSRVKQIRTVDNFFPLGSSPNGNDLPAGPSAGDILGNTRAAIIGDSQTFGTNIINDVRFGYTQVRIGILNTGVFGNGGFNPNVSANLGAPNINRDANSSGIILIGIVDTLGGGDRASEFTGDGGPFLFRSNNFNLADSVTVVKGSSVYKAGVDYRVRQNSNIDGGRNGAIKGNYQYGTTNSGFVSGNYNGIGPNDTGSALANFLLGYQPGFYTRGTPGTDALLSAKEVAFYVQDDWKTTSNLTLNLGLRYDLFTSPTERFNRISNFDPASGKIFTAGDNAPNGR